MPTLYTLREYINATLDKSYNRATSGMFQQIVRMATGQGSAVQAAMRELEAEAERLQEAGEVMKPDNPTIVKALSVIEDEMVATQNLILANGAEIEQSGQEVAPVATIAKLMMGITAVLLSRGVNPLQSESVYREAITQGGLGFVIPGGLDFVKMYTQSEAWIERMEGWGEGYAELIGKLAQKGASEGWGPIRMAREIRKYAENIPIWASENITRTLQLTAYRDASAAMELINGKFIEKKIRISALDNRVCPACLALHGTEIPLGEPVSDHYNGRCELPENLISGASISSLVSRNYNGEIIAIGTASGKLLPVTPNHPILTDRGWISAKLIRVGDNVVQYGSGEWASVGMYPNKEHVPTEAHNIGRSFSMRRLGSVPISSEDFHGDGIDGDVGIVWSNRFLWNMFNPIFIKPFGKKLLRFRSFTSPLSRFGDFTFMAHRQRFASRKLLGGFHNFLSFLSGHLGSFQPIGVCLGADINPRLYQNAIYNLSGNFQFFMDRINRSSSFIQVADIGNLGIGKPHPISSSRLHPSNSITFGFRSEQPIGFEMIMKSLVGNMPNAHGNCDIIPSQIRFDRVTNVGIRSYSGHVYSLQSNKGWYISNGIISHNCDAILIPVGGSMPESMQAFSKPGERNFVPWQTGEDWFAGLTNEQQRAFLGPGKFEVYKSGVPLSEFWHTHTDSVFGDMPVVKPLKDLLPND